jgi:hypothetical protein
VRGISKENDKEAREKYIAVRWLKSYKHQQI